MKRPRKREIIADITAVVAIMFVLYGIGMVGFAFMDHPPVNPAGKPEASRAGN